MTEIANVRMLKMASFSDVYRATLCVNAVLLSSGVLLCVYPSISLSVTFVYCIQTVMISSNFFLDPIAPSFYFSTPCANTKFQGEPFSGGAKYGVEKIAIFD